MKITRAFTTAPKMVGALALLAGLAGGAVALTGNVAGAVTMTGSTLSVSNNTANITGSGTTNTAVYTWNFTTVTAAYVPTKLTFTVPAGVAFTGTPVVTMFGITGCTVATPVLATTTITETPTGTCGSLAVGTPVSVAITNIKNGTTAAAGNSTISTFAGATAKDTGTAPYSFANNTTGVTVIVPDSLTFTNSNTAVSLLAVPGTVATANPVTLTVKTNAKSGYTLSGCVLAANIIKLNATNTIPQASNTTAAVLPTTGNTSAFGAQAALTAGTIHGTAALNTGWAATTATKFLGYGATCGVTGNQKISSDTGPTSGDVLKLTNGVGVSAVQGAGTYTGTISYQVTPSY